MVNHMGALDRAKHLAVRHTPVFPCTRFRGTRLAFQSVNLEESSALPMQVQLKATTAKKCDLSLCASLPVSQSLPVSLLLLLPLRLSLTALVISLSLETTDPLACVPHEG